MTRSSALAAEGCGSDPAGASETIRLLVVDDHPVVCSGIVQLLGRDSGLEVVGQAGDGVQAVALASALHPDVVLMDLRMPTMSGVEATRFIRALPHPPRVVILTTYETDTDVARAVEAGAIGYLLKDSALEEIADAVRAAAAGRPVMSEEVTSRFMRVARLSASSHGELSPRECEVLSVIAQGMSNAQAARHLCVSEATIKTHLRRAYTKLEVGSRAAAVAEAARRGLVEI